MITGIITTCLTGFLFFYYTSRRAIIEYRSATIEWIGAHAVESKIAAGGFFTISIVLAVLHWGFLGGIFSFVVILMTVGSLVLLLHPLKLFRPVYLVGITALIFVLEIIV